MVNRIFLLSGIVAILSVLSCSKMEIKENDAPVNPVREGRRTIEATMEEAFDEETKMTLGNLVGEKRSLSWSAGDKIAVIGSDKKTYLFTADSEGTKVRFTEADPDENDELNNNPMPDEVNIVYAFYPYDKIKSFKDSDPDGKENNGGNWVTIVAELPVEQNGNLLDNLLLRAVINTNGHLSFSFSQIFWKFTVPEDLHIKKLTMRSVDPSALLVGNVNFSFKKGTNDVSNSGCSSDFVTCVPKEGEGYVSGEIVLTTRHKYPGLSDYSKILEFENANGQFAFKKLKEVTSCDIHNFGEIGGDLRWYDKETVNVKFTQADWSFSSPAKNYSLFDGSSTANHYLSDRPYEFALTGGDYLFKVFAPVSIYAASPGLRLGADVNIGTKSYIEFPTLPGMALASATATFTKTGNDVHNGKSNIVDSKGDALLAPCGSKDITRSWNFVGLSPTTKLGETYKLISDGQNNMTTAELTLTYLGTDSTRPDAVSTGDADVYATLGESHPQEASNKQAYDRPFSDANVTLHGSFKMHTGRHASSPATIDDFECGFEYKAADDAEWTSVACPESAETFSVNVALNEDTDYLYRSYAKVSGGNKCYGMERRLKFIAFDFRNGKDANSMSVKSGLGSGTSSYKFTANEDREFYYPDATNRKYTFSCGFCNGGIGDAYSLNFEKVYLIFNRPSTADGKRTYIGFPAVPDYKLTAYTMYMQGVNDGSRTLTVSNKHTGTDKSADSEIELFTDRNMSVATRKEVIVPLNGKTRHNTGYYLIQEGNNWPITTIALRYE